MMPAYLEPIFYNDIGTVMWKRENYASHYVNSIADGNATVFCASFADVSLGSSGNIRYVFPSLNRDVYNLCIHNGQLIAACTSTVQGGVWSYDGASWNQVGQLETNTEYSIFWYGVCSWNGALIACGRKGVFQWNGTEWVELWNANIWKVGVYNGHLVAESNNDYPRFYFYQWNGSGWNNVADIDKTVFEPECVFNGGVITGDMDGVFRQVGSNRTRLGLLTMSYAQIVFNGVLYAGGCLSDANNGVFSWDGNTWNRVK